MKRNELKIRTQQAINAIRIFKGKDYGWSEMEKMLYEILIELDDSDWQTGTPTEEGWYLVAYKKRDCDGSFYWEYGARFWYEIIEGEGHWDVCEEKHPVIEWQRIEPHEEVKNGKVSD